MSIHSRLKHFPISFFAVVMGLSGLTIALQKTELFFNLSFTVSYYLFIFTAIVFVVLLAAYGLKLFLFPNEVKAELYHPIKLSFYPTISISFIMLSIITLSIWANLAEALWIIGSILHLSFTLFVLKMWIEQQNFRIEHMTPAWFIPLVGNILVPIAGVPLGYIEASWFYYSFGMLFWIVFLSILFNRIIFHHPVPTKLLPTLFIFIAPPSIGFLSYFNLIGHQIDNFSRILYYIAVFFLLSLTTLAKNFLTSKFYLSLWAYSFPLASITVSTLVMYHVFGGIFFKSFSILLLVGLILNILYLITRTIICVLRKGICVEE